jgi:internalin A
MKGIDIIREIEAIIGRKLQQVPFEELEAKWNYEDIDEYDLDYDYYDRYEGIKNSYTLDEEGILIGIDLNGCPVNLMPEGLWAEMKQIRYLDLEGTDLLNYEFIGQYKFIEFLCLNNLDISDITFISKLNKLTHLSLFAIKATDYIGIEQLNNLTFLNLMATQASDYNFLKHLTNLEYLILGSWKVNDCSFFEKLYNIKYLKFFSAHIVDYNIIGNLSKLRHLTLNSPVVSDYRFVGQLLNLRSLDLSDTQTSDYTEVGQLTGLYSLNLSNTKATDYKFVSQLTNLRSLNLSSTKATDYKFVNQLTNLRSLDLSGTKVSDYSYVGLLTNLYSLDLSSTKATDYKFIGQLVNLNFLDLGGTEALDYNFIGQLVNLRHLFLWDTKATDYNFIGQLVNLNFLNLSRTKATDYNFIGQLVNLKYLNLGGTEALDYNFIGQLVNLRRLFLWDIKATDYNFIGQLVNLKYLNLGGTEATDYNFIYQLQNLSDLYLNETVATEYGFVETMPMLRSLSLAFNEIKTFPEYVLNMPNLKYLYLKGNPIQDIELELLGEELYEDCLKEVKNYFQLLDQRGYVLNQQMKLMLVGNGRVGKTCVVKSLFGEPCLQEEPSTHAIIQRALRLPETPKYPAADVQIWDFGGQDIYRGTHRIFMQHKTLYLLVWDSISEQQTNHDDGQGGTFNNYPIHYWLDYIKEQSPDSHIILLRNKADDGAKELPYGYAKLKEKYNIVDYFDYSAMQPERKGELLDLIQKHITGAPQFGRKIPKPWFNIRAELQALAQDPANRLIDYAVYEALCDAENLKEFGPFSEKNLLQYLHITGVLYHDERLFGGNIILDQKWAIEGINTLFDREKCYYELHLKKGRFTRADLAHLAWADKTPREQELYLNFMESCEICFPLESKSGTAHEYIAPHFLPPYDIAHKKDLDRVKVTGIYYIYTYQYFHLGIFHRFMARVARRMNHKNDVSFTSDVIRFGAYAQDTEAIIEYRKTSEKSHEYQGQIIINVSGSRHRELLADIVEEFKDLNKNAEVEEFASLDLKGSISIVDLKDHLENGLSQYRSKEKITLNLADFEEYLNLDWVNKRGEDPHNPYNVQEKTAFTPISLPQAERKKTMFKSPYKIFISYKSDDRKLREYFEKELKQYLNASKHQFETVWSDAEIVTGTDWDEEIKKQLDNSDIGILLVSQKFLASRYIKDVELSEMLERRAQEGYILIPILLRDCDFKDNPDLKNIQFVKSLRSDFDPKSPLDHSMMPFDEIYEFQNETLLNKYFMLVRRRINLAIENRLKEGG